MDNYTPPVYMSIAFELDAADVPLTHLVIKELRTLLERIPKNEVGRILQYLRDWNNDRKAPST